MPVLADLVLAGVGVAGPLAEAGGAVLAVGG